MSNSVLLGLDLAIKDLENDIAEIKSRIKELKKLKNKIKKGDDKDEMYILWTSYRRWRRLLRIR